MLFRSPKLQAFQREVQEVRADQCCSRCGKSRSELAGQGIQFEQHLSEVAGVAQHCPPGKHIEVVRRWTPVVAQAEQHSNALQAKADELVRQQQALAESRSNVAAARRSYDKAMRDATLQVERAQAGR